VTVALATNCNPGSSYTTSMAFCVATAVLRMGMSVLDAPSAVHLAYRPGVPLTWAVWRRGHRVV
jgi:imidazolonepropionase